MRAISWRPESRPGTGPSFSPVSLSQGVLPVSSSSSQSLLFCLRILNCHLVCLQALHTDLYMRVGGRSRLQALWCFISFLKWGGSSSAWLVILIVFCLYGRYQVIRQFLLLWGPKMIVEGISCWIIQGWKRELSSSPSTGLCSASNCPILCTVSHKTYLSRWTHCLVFYLLF